MTDQIRGGTQRGFCWGIYTTEKGEERTIIWEEGDEAPDLTTKAWSWNWVQNGFFPFDDTVPRSNYEYYFHDFDAYRFKVKEWFDRYIESPSNCDIVMKLEHYRRKIVVEATTIKNGRLTKVRKRIHNQEDVLTQAKKIYAYFAKNCPAPDPQNAAHFAISGITQGLIDSLKPGAVEDFRKWFKIVENHTGAYSMATSFRGQMSRIEGMEKIEFHYHPDAAQITSIFTLKDGAKYKEDLTGGTFTLGRRIKVPEVMLNGAKGKPLSKFIDIAGAESAIIRKAGTKRDEGTKIEEAYFRFALDLQEIIIPETTDCETEEEILEDIQKLLANGHLPIQTDYALSEVLNKLEPKAMRSVLSRLLCYEQVNLKDYGGKDLELEMNNATIRLCYGQPYPFEYRR